MAPGLPDTNTFDPSASAVDSCLVVHTPTGMLLEFHGHMRTEPDYDRVIFIDKQTLG